MCRRLLFWLWMICAVGSPVVACAFAVQDSIRVDTESEADQNDSLYAVKDKELWSPGRFDSIAVNTGPVRYKVPPYKEVIARYQQDEFVYSENIKDRIGFVERVLSRFKRWLESIFPQDTFNWSEKISYLFACVALVALAFILYKVLYNRNVLYRRARPEEEETYAVEYVEKNLMQVNLIPYIQEMEKKGNYALAIRYLQLLTIQKLAQAGYIIWKVSKTNSDFSTEIQNESLREEYDALTRIFNRVWFGRFALAEPDFQVYSKMFYDYQRRIK